MVIWKMTYGCNDRRYSLQAAADKDNSEKEDTPYTPKVGESCLPSLMLLTKEITLKPCCLKVDGDDRLL